MTRPFLASLALVSALAVVPYAVEAQKPTPKKGALPRSNQVYNEVVSQNGWTYTYGADQIDTENGQIPQTTAKRSFTALPVGVGEAQNLPLFAAKPVDLGSLRFLRPSGVATPSCLQNRWYRFAQPPANFCDPFGVEIHIHPRKFNYTFVPRMNHSPLTPCLVFATSTGHWVDGQC